MTDNTSTGSDKLPAPLGTALRLFVIIALPLLLILINARLLMTDAFLRFEYNLPNFPPDTYGFTQEDRLRYAPLALDYLFNDEDISFLGNQTFPDGRPLYNERELAHMVDVKEVTGSLLTVGWILAGVFIAVVIGLGVFDQPQLLKGLLAGSIVTIFIILAGLIAVATSFNWLFTEFHNLFFEEGTWIFLYSDTLIRLFPIQFWTHAFALIFGGTLLEAGVIGAAAWRLGRNQRT